MVKVLQLKISLADINPQIWRVFLVEDTISFHKLHEIIQRVMGWENYHLYMFDINSVRIGEPYPDYEEDILDSKKIKLNIFPEKKGFVYEYDFGDSWRHILTVKKILGKDSTKKYPLCAEGERCCPPEDSGGSWGYEELLKIRKNKNHPEYKEKIVGWLGEDFNPECFNIEEVNKTLKKFQK